MSLITDCPSDGVLNWPFCVCVCVFQSKVILKGITCKCYPTVLAIKFPLGSCDRRLMPALGGLAPQSNLKNKTGHRLGITSC